MIREDPRRDAHAARLELRDERVRIGDRQNRANGEAAQRLEGTSRTGPIGAHQRVGLESHRTRAERRARRGRAVRALRSTRASVAAFRVTTTSVARRTASSGSRHGPAGSSRTSPVQRSALTSTRSASALHAPVLKRIVEHGDVGASSRRLLDREPRDRR